MKRNTMLFVLAAAALCAVSARAQGQAANSDQAQTAQPQAVQTQTKEQKKAAWENGVKTDCAAEIAVGGVCAGKDFGSGLEKCLHENRKTLSDGCKATVHPHHKHSKGQKSGAQTGDMQAPAAAPQQAPAATPQ